jgi:hypothetical protein
VEARADAQAQAQAQALAQAEHGQAGGSNSLPSSAASSRVPSRAQTPSVKLHSTPFLICLQLAQCLLCPDDLFFIVPIRRR